MKKVGQFLDNLRQAHDNSHKEIATRIRMSIEPEDYSTDEKRESKRRALKISNLDNTFDNFRIEPGAESSLSAFKELLKEETDKRLLLCYGGVGNGKTHLCEATALELYQRGIFCRVLTMAVIMRSLKHSMSNETITSYDELLTRLCTATHLIIDDAGRGCGTVWDWERLDEIIGERYRAELFTIMTTNMDLIELPERVVSRFRDNVLGIVVLNQAEDYRPKKEVIDAKKNNL